MNYFNNSDWDHLENEITASAVVSVNINSHENETAMHSIFLDSATSLLHNPDPSFDE